MNTNLLFSLPLAFGQGDHSDGDFYGIMITFAFIFIPLFIIFFISRAIESAHFRRLAEGESACRDIFVSDISFTGLRVDPTQTPQWIASEVVISSSRIKDFFARWRNFFGGEIKSYQTLQERALREVRLRLCLQAQAMGHDAICNLRFTATQISLASISRTKGPVMICMQASATAFTRSV